MLFWNRPTLFESAEKDKRNGGSAREAIGGDDSKITENTQLYRGVKFKDQLRAKLEKIRQEHQFDREANKDLESLSRRGVEAGIDYERRRAEGFPPKNERDDPTSRYSLDNIEESLLVREAQNGVEYGVYWDKDGELIGINRGTKGQVSSYRPRDKDGNPNTRDATFTHTHPSETAAGRELGLSFSPSDVNNHGDYERKETRAVAREGTYILRGKAELSDEARKQLSRSSSGQTLLRSYDSTQDPYIRSRIATSILAKEIDSTNIRLQRTGGSMFGHESNRDGTWFSSAKFATLMAVEHANLCRKYGLQYEFKAKAGFEQMEKIVMGRFNPSDSASELAKIPARPDVIARGQFPQPRGNPPVDAKGNTVPLARQPIVTARGFKIGEAVDVRKEQTKNQTRPEPQATPSPVATPTTTTAPVATPKAPRKPRVAKPKVTDIKPPPTPKTPAVKVEPTIGVGTTPSTTTLPFSGRGSLRTTGGFTFGSSLSGTGSLFGN